jgi:hypothetical protein
VTCGKSGRIKTKNQTPVAMWESWVLAITPNIQFLNVEKILTWRSKLQKFNLFMVRISSHCIINHSGSCPSSKVKKSIYLVEAPMRYTLQLYYNADIMRITVSRGNLQLKCWGSGILQFTKV